MLNYAGGASGALTGAASGSALGPIGTGVGAAVGFVAGIFSGENNAGNTSNATLLKNLVNYANQNGVNLNTDDVLHMLPGNWGSPDMYQEDAQYIMQYVQEIKNGTLNYSGAFGGGYLPTHSITYNKSQDTSLATPVPGSVTTTSQTGNVNPTSGNGTINSPYMLAGVTTTANRSYIYYILGAIVLVLIFYAMKKKA